VATNAAAEQFDVVVVGAGFAGMYLLHRLRQDGFSAVVLETADDVGGTWYWNRYPGARCDVETLDYTFTFDPELEKAWIWSERYAAQPEILRYAQFIAHRYDLRRDIRFGTKAMCAVWDDTAHRWTVRTDTGSTLSASYYVMATGCLSMPKTVDIDGTERFRGDVYWTSSWPHQGVDLAGKRVGVIGTGSSAIQSIPIIAQQASQLTVFQRTANFSLPARNGPVKPEKRAPYEEDPAAYREAAKWSRGGVPFLPMPTEATMSVSAEERQRRFELGWEVGDLFHLSGAFADIVTDEAANDAASEFLRNKIRAVVDDPQTAEDLCPQGYPYATKRPCLDTNYFQTFNLPHVRLVNLKRTPIVTITETGLDTTEESFGFDVIVYATGFDAMTGAIVAVDIEGRDGLSLKEKWANGPQTYLGLGVEGFPNLFTITGPQSPSVLSNMMVSIEQHVEWIADTLVNLRSDGFDTIEPTPTAEQGWLVHNDDCAALTLFDKATSWYVGANVAGKPRVVLPYLGGVDAYRQICNEVVEGGYVGFRLSGPGGKTQVNDGLIREIQPDVGMILQMMAQMGLPAIDSMSPAEARAFMEQSAAASPPGPEVGEVVDGTLPGPGGDLAYRLYRPASPGPHPVVLYFHGGGWVLGSATSDDAYCRDLCNQAGAVVISADYRHAPEARFPAPVEDAYAALQWVAANAEALGGDPGRLAVAGWSAGGNLAAVVCQLAKAAGGPDISAQLLITPVTDSDVARPSYRDNGEGYLLTRSLMEWFWNHYCDPADRTDPRAAPLRAADLSGLPPAIVVTAQFDPLRDEGDAYAAALAAAGVDVVHLPARGQNHTSITGVGMFLSPRALRTEIAGQLARLTGARVGV
jgi:cation diffusion facilitator CzcD-associated flavoprotein CzcO/acetyl esterase/lipase